MRASHRAASDSERLLALRTCRAISRFPSLSSCRLPWIAGDVMLVFIMPRCVISEFEGHTTKLFRPKKVIDESVIVKEKGPKGRPKIPDDVRKITPPEYFVDYYRAKGCCEVECPNCKRFVTRSNISKHKKSLFCRDFTAPAI